KCSAGKAESDLKTVPLHQQISDAVARHDRDEKKMQLIRVESLVFAQAKCSHAEDRSDPHNQDKPTQRAGFASLEAMKQRDEENQSHCTPAKVFENVICLGNEVV